jgi:hypothetical protein
MRRSLGKREPLLSAEAKEETQDLAAFEHLEGLKELLLGIILGILYLMRSRLMSRRSRILHLFDRLEARILCFGILGNALIA